MLTEKDYCDYETCVALKELGYDGYCAAYYHLFDDEDDARNSFEYAYGFDFQNSNNIYRVGAPLLYQAQKFLREEKNIIVDVRYGAQYYNVVLNHRITLGRHIVMDKNNRIADFTKYEEALLEGVKCAVKILEENETIHR